MSRPVSGTREWAVASVNTVTGCSHDCRYCYAKYNACDRFKSITHEDWSNKKVRMTDVLKKRHKIDGGRVMFPTTHDICPDTLEPCITVIKNLLDVGNELLIVSKPHFVCIQEICGMFSDFKDKILFRFTIGSRDDMILKYWEPGAPCYAERLASLSLAKIQGFSTSVSIEPMLDPSNVISLVQSVYPDVTDSIWLGKMNNIEKRVKQETAEDREQVKRIVDGQTDDNIKKIYEKLKSNNKVRWKESIKDVLDLARPEEAGLDI